MSLTTAKSSTGQDLPAFVTPDGVPRLLAAIPDPSGRKTAPAYSATNEVIPAKDWLPYRRFKSTVPIMNQGSHGSCVGHGSCTALMRSRDTAGMTFQLLSPTMIYSQINGGRDAGANLGDAATELVKTGTCLMSTFPESQIYRPSPTAFAEAKRFICRPGMVFSCANFEELVSAWLLGFDAFLSVKVGANFGNLNSNGVAPFSPGPGNHCVATGDELISVGGTWYLDLVNSWDTSWGQGGHFKIGAQHVDHQPYYEAYAVKAALDDPLDPMNPPDLV
ncbi:unnamed protein product [uncultured bacterium]|nr:unnamed protein product [uncultured bacterium]